MTTLQKEIIEKLLIGYNIVGNQVYGYRLRSPEQHVCRRFGHRTFLTFRNVLRQKDGMFFLNRAKVRQLHNNSWIKKQYKQNLQATAI